MHRKSLQNTGLMLFDTETLEKPEYTTLHLLTSSAEDSPARISAMQENEQELREAVRDCGVNTTVSFASYDLSTCLWRTSQLSLEEELIPYSETFPRAGMMRNGKCYQQVPLVLHISELGSSLLPTPLAVNATGGSANRNRKDMPYRYSLARMATGNKWPTPAARDYRGAGKRESYLVRRQFHQQSLNEEVVHGLNGQAGGQLNPQFVEWLMGFPQGWTELKDSETQ